MKIVYIYLFAKWGLTLTDAPFNHPLYPDAAPAAEYLAEPCTEPKLKKPKNHFPCAGDTVFVNCIDASANFQAGKWFVLQSENTEFYN